MEVAVGQPRQCLVIDDQVISGPAAGQQQAQDLAVDFALARERGRGCRRDRQHLVGLGDIGSVPAPHRFRDADDLAIAGARAQRLRVQVSRHDPPPRRQRVRTVEIGMGRGVDHLPQLFDDAGRASFGRMTKFFGLGRERAGAAGAKPPIDDACDASCRGEREPVPVDRRVAIRRAGCKEIAVFDKGKAVGDERRDRREIRVSLLGIARPVERGVVAVVKRQPGALLFVIDRVAAVLDEMFERRRPPRLIGDREMVLLERMDEARQGGIPEPLVIGAVLGER